MASPSSIISFGLGAWGSASLLITLGFGAGAAAVALMPPTSRRIDIAAETRAVSVRNEQRVYNMPAEDRIIEVRNDI